MAEITGDALQIGRKRRRIDTVGLHDGADHGIGEGFA